MTEIRLSPSGPFLDITGDGGTGPTGPTGPSGGGSSGSSLVQTCWLADCNGIYTLTNITRANTNSNRICSVYNLSGQITNCDST